MNKNELKKMLKPLIKECIKEVIFEDGTLSTIISEVLKGTSGQQIVVEAPAPSFKRDPEIAERKRKQLLEQKKRMLDSIGADAYNGVNLFEGTTPLPTNRGTSSNPAGSGALDGVAAGDPGVDLSSFGITSNTMKKLVGN
mgnify:CR=1 FL=1|jgi:hypothetical protein|tara:strand:+ start:3596 stop:4015 length:420 start_codon:yes stop_codon:yes gene_type:complete